MSCAELSNLQLHQQIHTHPESRPHDLLSKRAAMARRDDDSHRNFRFQPKDFNAGEFCIDFDRDIVPLYRREERSSKGYLRKVMLAIMNFFDTQQDFSSTIMSNYKHVSVDLKSGKVEDMGVRMNFLLQQFNTQRLVLTLEMAANFLDGCVYKARHPLRKPTWSCVHFHPLDEEQETCYGNRAFDLEDSEYERIYFLIWMLSDPEASKKLQSSFENFCRKSNESNSSGIAMDPASPIVDAGQAFICAWLCWGNFVSSKTRLPVVVDIGKHREVGAGARNASDPFLPQRRLLVAVLKVEHKMRAFAVNSEFMNSKSFNKIYDCWSVSVRSTKVLDPMWYNESSSLSLVDVAAGFKHDVCSTNLAQECFEIVDFPHVVVIPYKPVGGFDGLPANKLNDENSMKEHAISELSQWTRKPSEDNIFTMIEIWAEKSAHGLIILRNLAFSHPSYPMAVSHSIVVTNRRDIFNFLYPEYASYHLAELFAPGKTAVSRDKFTERSDGKATHEHPLTTDQRAEAIERTLMDYVPVRIFPFHLPPLLKDVDTQMFKNIVQHHQPFQSTLEAAAYFSAELSAEGVDVDMYFHNSKQEIRDLVESTLSATLRRARELALDALVLLSRMQAVVQAQEGMVKLADDMKKELEAAVRPREDQIFCCGERPSKTKNNTRAKLKVNQTAEASVPANDRLMAVLRNYERKVLKMRHFRDAYNRLFQSGLLEKFFGNFSDGRQRVLHGPEEPCLRLLLDGGL